MTVTIRINTANTVANLTDLEKSQLPFAISLMLNTLGTEGQAAERIHFAQVFTERQKSFLDREGVKRIGPAATKRNPSVTFGVSDRANFLNKFEDGTPKTPISGRNLAIPGDVRRNKKDIITKANRPRVLVNKLGPKAFVLETQKGKLLPGIYQRTGRGGRTLKRLYLFEPQVKTPRVLDFEQTFAKVVHDRADLVFQQSLARAVATAK